MTETLETIRAEVEQFVQNRPEGWNADEHFCLYFNNFHLNLPHGGRRQALQDYLDDPRMVKGGRTPREFFKDMDESLAAANISHDQIKALQGNSAYRKALMELVLPAYVGLRNKGYSKKDLCS